jgi:antitoxin VapB
LLRPSTFVTKRSINSPRNWRRCKHLNKTEALKFALENELRRIEKSQPLRERLRNLQNRVLARTATGLEADKAFYDDLSGPA